MGESGPTPRSLCRSDCRLDGNAHPGGGPGSRPHACHQPPAQETPERWQLQPAFGPRTVLARTLPQERAVAYSGHDGVQTAGPYPPHARFCDPGLPE